MVNIQSKVLVYESELNYLAQCILDYPETETGCDLFGFWTQSGHTVIQYIIGPGEGTKRTVTSFHQDEEYLKSIGDELRKTHGLQHLGNFHSHHKFKLKKPSQHDSNTVVKAMNLYHLDRFILMIGNIVNENRTTINAYQYTRGKENLYNHSGFVVLPGESPIRTVFDVTCSSYLYKPKSDCASMVNLLIATLEEQVYSKPEYPLNYWLRSKKNREILNGIMHKLNQQFDSVRAKQDDRTRLVYLFFGTTDGRIIKVTFTEEFPTTAPAVASFDFDWFKYVPFANSSWISDGSLVLNSVNYIVELVTKADELKEASHD